MIDFNVPAALVAGLVAVVVMSMMMTAAARSGMTDMPPMPLVTGSMFIGNRQQAMTLGSIIHYGMMGTVMFGLAYAWLFSALDETAWWLGALAGIVHGVVVGVVFMPMMPAMHPRMVPHRVGAGPPADRGTVATGPDGEVELAGPGLLGRNWGAMTPAGLVMGHAVYGIVVALVYEALR